MLSCMSGFIFIPLYPICLDFIMPLNETRHRQQLFRLTYFIDEEEYFYLIYFYTIWCSFATVMIAITIDSLYIQIIHHDCALFVLCGQSIITATQSTVTVNETYTERFRQCLSKHKNAFQLFELLDNSSRKSYFCQILLTMIGMTVTAVKIVMNLHRLEEAFRFGLYFVAQQFHLLIITLPGQVITDHSFELSNYIYRSTWYNMPIKIQKILHTMQMRSSKSCKLTAGGIYEMNIENFGITFKTCVSYFTVLLSLRD
ncbi:odorant receptor 33b-like [Frieseomelitta varia]|uniref:odorant receptor 33b-like n=1 Tax=Frieseomelitta varia TaxID=561572 RepID=UPI001CB68300|nr:odorant receptor 33b-like [Frieseomelitta varia]